MNKFIVILNSGERHEITCCDMKVSEYGGVWFIDFGRNVASYPASAYQAAFKVEDVVELG